MEGEAAKGGSVLRELEEADGAQRRVELRERELTEEERGSSSERVRAMSVQNPRRAVEEMHLQKGGAGVGGEAARRRDVGKGR